MIPIPFLRVLVITRQFSLVEVLIEPRSLLKSNLTLLTLTVRNDPSLVVVIFNLLTNYQFNPWVRGTPAKCLLIRVVYPLHYLSEQSFYFFTNFRPRDVLFILTLFFQTLTVAYPGVWDAVSKNFIEIEVLLSQEFNCIALLKTLNRN